MVIADSSANPSYVAAALLAQAEHGSGKEKIYFLFNEETLFPLVMDEIDAQLKSLPIKNQFSEFLKLVFGRFFFPISKGFRR